MVFFILFFNKIILCINIKYDSLIIFFKHQFGITYVLSFNLLKRQLFQKLKAICKKILFEIIFIK